ncbi:hypothetical protein KSP40_PGU021884 [Platanthera guangdongensis]|uniref:Uncharacterized protein n=1 Tax=Platanthera guangdongensis TaxID=2320717 RepID=A0ABR2LX63_9ASPA
MISVILLAPLSVVGHILEARDSSSLRGRAHLLADGVYPAPKVIDEGATRFSSLPRFSSTGSCLQQRGEEMRGSLFITSSLIIFLHVFFTFYLNFQSFDLCLSLVVSALVAAVNL